MSAFFAEGIGVSATMGSGLDRELRLDSGGFAGGAGICTSSPSLSLRFHHCVAGVAGREGSRGDEAGLAKADAAAPCSGVSIGDVRSA